MVSSKCCQVESPSPLRFFAALMPPCAHTECERLTGTIENRSTLPPISAILITAARPARPPPITTIFGLDAILRYRLSELLCRTRSPIFHRPGARRIGRLQHEPRPEGVQAGEAHDAHHQAKPQARGERGAARSPARNTPPLGANQPQAVGEVPRRADQAHHVEQKKSG